MKEKIIEYELIIVHTASDLPKLVNEAIAAGWQPYGPVVLNTSDTFGPSAIQPIVKYGTVDNF